MTKNEALKKAGYVPKMGRPRIDEGATRTVGVRLPVSVIDKIPDPKSEWIRGAIKKMLSGTK